MKWIFLLLLIFSLPVFAQPCADEDTVRNNAASLITSNSVRINGTVAHFSGTPVSLQLKYVRVGQTDTVTSTAAWPTVVRNLTGLQSSTQYFYYYKTICGSGTNSQIGAYYFTTLTSVVTYTPMTAMGYQFKYLKADSGLLVPRIDTSIGRAPDVGGSIVWNPADSIFYGYDGEYWHPLAIDSAGILPMLNLKVDSVTVSGDSLFYWVNGTGYGQILPSAAPYDATVDFSVNADPNTVGTTFSPNTPQLTTKIYVSTIDGSLWTWNGSAYILYTSNSWDIWGNYGTTAGTNFIGTTDAVDLVAAANNTEQLRLLSTGGIRIPVTIDSTVGVIFKGSDRFIHNFSLPGTSTTLGENLFIGKNSGNFTMTGSSGGFGTRNLAIGDSTLFANTTGYRNVAIGTWAGATNTSGYENTIVGANASQYSTSRQNTAIGAISMNSTTTGERNTALGFSSLQTNTTGSRNTALGSRAMQFSGSSFANVAVGFDALAYGALGDHNVALGLDALYYSDGTHNVAIGDSTLWGLYLVQKHMGYKNVAVGSRAGYHLGDTYPNFASIFDTACIFLGGNASRDSSIPYTTSLQNMTVIGYDARGFASNQVVLGNDNVTTTLLKGAINMRGYGSGTNTGTPTYSLQVDAAGNVIEGAAGGGGISGLTTNELVYGNSATTIASLPVATYPSLTELSYVKGVTSAIQTQLGAKISALAAIGSSPNANGATISGSTLNLEPASGSFGGVVTTGTQTFAGLKTFSMAGQAAQFTSTGYTPTTVRISDPDGNMDITNSQIRANTNQLQLNSNASSISLQTGGVERVNVAASTGIVKMTAYGAGAATFDASGNISSASDIRLKNLQGYYYGGLKEVMKIKPIIYKWNEKSGLETKENYIGFSAQNIKESLGEGSYGINKDGYLSIQDRAILAAVIGAIQEQQKEIEKLKEQVKRLTVKNDY